MTPSTVALAFETSATRAGAGRAGGRRRAGAGLRRRARSTADPPTVEVVGPESAVKRATEAMTEPVSVAGAREHGARDGHRRAARSVAAAEDAAHRRWCTVQIVPAPLERTLRDRPVHLRNLGAQSDGAGDAGGRRRQRCAAAATASAASTPTTSTAFVDLGGPRRRRLHAAGARRRRRATRASRASSRRRCRCESPVAKTESIVPRLFGTDGVRGTAGRYPLDPRDRPPARRGARPRAAARHGSRRSLLVGRDTRESGAWIEAELAHGASRRRRDGDERRRRADAGGRLSDARRRATTPAS